VSCAHGTLFRMGDAASREQRICIMSLLFRPYRPIVRLVAGVVPREGAAAPKLQGAPAGAQSASRATAQRPPHPRSGSWPLWPPSPGSRRRLHRRDRIVGTLERLARLHAAGELDDAEYAAAKSTLLRS
jgi:hypothetical protein